MLRTTTGRLTAVLALLALVVAMGGAGYAGVKIGTKQLKSNAVTTPKIKNNAVTTDKVKNNAVTSDKIKDNTIVGGDVLEISLNTVPSAASINGMRPAYVHYRSTSPTPVIIFNEVGLKITASCTGNDIGLLATTVKEDSSIYTQVVDTETPATFGGDFEGQTFDIGTTFNLLANAGVSNEDPAIVTFVYDALDVSVVTGTLSTDFGTGGNCGVSGTLLYY